MKNINKLALVLSLGALVPLAASAKTLEQAYIESCSKGPDIPVPVAVVAPITHSWDEGQEVQIGFVVNKAGYPSDISIVSSNDYDLAEAVVTAVKQWRFTPAQVNGVPVATRVVLPVRVVSSDDTKSLALD
ncbi:MAG TPA: energy transducer TonB [Opitutaceae bacterium]|nr:energy transducer TonB [Opitutaceae bacterium]